MSDSIPYQIGREYVEAQSLPEEDSLSTWRAYRKIVAINEVKYRQIPVPVIFQESDPYDSYEDMRESVRRDREIRVFTGGSHPPYMSQHENIVGRVVHDWFGHLSADCDFSFEGEFTKWKHIKDGYPSDCKKVLLAEVVGQLSAAIYLENGFSDERFRQRVFQAPDRWVGMAQEYVS